jgi:hypothetical protein
MKKIKYSMIIATLLLLSCKKNGTGGDVEVAAFPEHHGKPIYGATMYVKFGATDLPSDPTNKYDMKVEGEPNEEHVHINGLRYGKYYIYAVGYDSSIHMPVTGGLAVKIKWKERKGEIDVHVPVSE